MYLPRRYWSIYCITFTINFSSSIFQSSQKFNSSNPLLEPVNLKVRFQIKQYSKGSQVLNINLPRESDGPCSLVER